MDAMSWMICVCCWSEVRLLATALHMPWVSWATINVVSLATLMMMWVIALSSMILDCSTVNSCIVIRYGGGGGDGDDGLFLNRVSTSWALAYCKISTEWVLAEMV